jgi:hypothetical protein
MVGEISSHYLLQPLPLLNNRVLYALSESILQRLEGSPYAIAAGFSEQQKCAAQRLPCDVGETKKISNYSGGPE